MGCSQRAGGKCCHRYFVAIHVRQGLWLALRKMESFNGAVGLLHAARRVSRAADGEGLLFPEVRQFSDAKFGILQGWLCHSRQLLRKISGAARIAWLCAASSLPCSKAIQLGSEVWLKVDTDHRHELAAFSWSGGLGRAAC